MLKQTNSHVNTEPKYMLFTTHIVIQNAFNECIKASVDFVIKAVALACVSACLHLRKWGKWPPRWPSSESLPGQCFLKSFALLFSKCWCGITRKHVDQAQMHWYLKHAILLWLEWFFIYMHPVKWFHYYKRNCFWRPRAIPYLNNSRVVFKSNSGVKR